MMTKRWNSAAVGVDFSDVSKRALEMAALLQDKGKLNIFAHHVVDASGIAELADALRMPQVKLIRELQEKGSRQVADWTKEAGFKITPNVTTSFGNPAKELIALGHAHDLLILGERGESHPGRGVGSSAVQCVRKCKGKVLLVDGIRTQVQVNKVVASLDFSPASAPVVNEALTLAQMCDAKIEFLHVYRAPWDRLHYRAPTAEASPQFRREYLEMLQKQMDDCIININYTKQSNALYRSTSYGYGIADYVRKTRADLVVLGTHGRSTLKELYLGSTAERLLRELPCSVLTVRTG